MKIFKLIAFIITVSLAISCQQGTTIDSMPAVVDSVKHVEPNAFKAIKYIDQFMYEHKSEIQQNNALKETNEALVTKKMLPLIDHKGLYDDLPFKLVMTTTHNGIAYGNFIYDDDRHYVKVTCIIKKKQLMSLKEDEKYLIKFKVVKFEDGVSFENEFSNIELPTVNGRLLSFEQLP